MALPKPGEVINYSYLWEYEFRKGRDEGVKDRPVAVVLVTQLGDGLDQVHVVPLSAERPWIIVTECIASPGRATISAQFAAPSHRSVTVSYTPVCSGRFGMAWLQPRSHGKSAETISLGLGRLKRQPELFAGSARPVDFRAGALCLSAAANSRGG